MITKIAKKAFFHVIKRIFEFKWLTLTGNMTR